MNTPWKKMIFLAFAFEILVIFLLVIVNGKWLKIPLTDNIIIFGLFIVMIPGGLIIAKSSIDKQIVNGALFGLFTVIVYILISEIAEQAGMYRNTYDLDYFLKHVAKILGGALGGMMVLISNKKELPSKAVIEQ